MRAEKGNNSTVGDFVKKVGYLYFGRLQYVTFEKRRKRFSNFHEREIRYEVREYYISRMFKRGIHYT